MRRIFERTAITQHTLGNIGADATGGGALDLSTDENQKVVTGILRGMTFVCSSTNFDVHIGQKENFALEGIDQIYKSEANNLRLQTDNIARGWVSGDNPRASSLYVVIHNNDSGNATGTIQVQLTSNIHKRFGK